MFRNCENLKNIEGFENIEVVGKEAFMNCKSLTPTLNLSYISSFGSYSFSGCSSLVSISLQEDVELGESVFENCNNLLEIEIPSSIDELPNNLFTGCQRLTKIIINKHNNSDFNLSIFDNCKNISYIEIKESERYSTPNNNCIYDKLNHKIIYVCKNISLFEINLEDYDEHISIEDGAFINCLCNIILIKDIPAPDININTFKGIRYKNYHILINKNDPKYSIYTKILGKKHIYSYIVKQDEINDDGNSNQPQNAPIDDSM